MKTDREKLIALLMEAMEEGEKECLSTANCPDCRAYEKYSRDECGLALSALHLIANGVVVREWIPVTERLPELIPCNAGTAYSEAVIVWTDGRKAMIAVWDGIDFLCAADYWEAWGENITHWMPLPKPPKEGE